MYLEKSSENVVDRICSLRPLDLAIEMHVGILLRLPGSGGGLGRKGESGKFIVTADGSLSPAAFRGGSYFFESIVNTLFVHIYEPSVRILLLVSIKVE